MLKPFPSPARGAKPQRRQPAVSLIGVGAFGEFCIPHLRRFAKLTLHDPGRDLTAICERFAVKAVDLPQAAAQDIVILAVPLPRLRAVARAIAPHLPRGGLVIDVCSVKTKPLAILAEELPSHVEIVGTHPLFGPQSGRDGIAGLHIALCPARGRSAPLLERFLRRRLKLAVTRMSAEQHDRQMAYVQGLTHLIARIVVAMDLPPLHPVTTTFSHLDRMVAMVRHDSDELFRTIVADNPFTGDVLHSFARATKDVLQPFGYPANEGLLG